MKVLHLTESFPPIRDATAIAVYNCASALNGLGADCVVAAPRMQEMSGNADFGLITYRSLSMVADGEYPLGLPYFPGTMRKLVEIKPDIIHVHTPFSAMNLARRLRKKLDTPVVLTYHSKYSYDIERMVSQKIIRGRLSAMVLSALNDADEVWIPSKTVASDISRLGFSGGHFVVENGTDIQPGDPDSEMITELRTRYNIAFSDPVMLFCGRMVWHKNIKPILDALCVLREKSFNFRMLFVGDGVDRASMEDYVSAKKLDGVVRFVGHIDDRKHMASFYGMSDLLVCPSTTDTAPPALIEAAACGLPALLAAGSDAAVGVQDGLSGFLCEPTAQGLSGAMIDKLSDRRSLRRVGAAARTKLYVPWSVAAEKMLKRYEMVLKLKI